MSAATRPIAARRPRLLVVEDNDALREGAAIALRELGLAVDVCDRGDTACERLANAPPYDLVLSDLRLPGRDGRAVLRAARQRSESTQVLLMTAYGNVDAAVDSMREGASDFLSKPFPLEQLERRVLRALAAGEGETPEPLSAQVEPEAPRADAAEQSRLVVKSRAMRGVVDLARRVAPARSTVLITGETGTGKEVVAGLVHRLSPRAGSPFVKVNCAALPETLLESELFGHERGAFTGADRQRIGRFEEASGGTLLLDEIAELSPTTQAKLLRVVQEQEFHRLGGTRTLRTDARIVAATNRDLEAKIREGAFREDLYYRLNVIGIHLPPLRERPEDTEVLAELFLADFSRELGREPRCFTSEALERIRAYRWPGNVRQLRNTIERAVLMSDREAIEAADLLLPASALDDREGESFSLPPGRTDLAALERLAVETALARTGYVQKDAAAVLGVSRRKLNYMIRRMGLVHPSWRRNRGESAETREK